MAKFRCADPECRSSAVAYRSRANNYVCRSCGGVFTREQLAPYKTVTLTKEILVKGPGSKKNKK